MRGEKFLKDKFLVIVNIKKGNKKLFKSLFLNNKYKWEHHLVEIIFLN